MKRFLSIFLWIALLLMQVNVAAQGTQISFELQNPSVKVFLPSAQLSTGRAVVACPGGGYSGLAVGHEGDDWASFFNERGIALIVLRYRMPHGDRTLPISDAEAALKMVHDSATVWHINPEEIGIMGSSAGGHLASTIATHARPSIRPDFQILFYPVITMNKKFTHMGSHDNLLGKDASAPLERLYSNEKQVTTGTPRAFIAFSEDDNVVPPLNGVCYYAALRRCKVPVDFHLYPTGGHGWGIRNNFSYHQEMLDDLSTWLEGF